jgi:hypothetical protein
MRSTCGSGLFIWAVCFPAFALSTGTPEQIHVAFAGDAGTGMTVSWATSGDGLSAVSFGLSPTDLNHNATGSSKSYLSPLYHHHATLSDLTPSTTYYYEISGSTSVLHFTTAAPSSNSEEFSASVFGDWGYGKNGHAIATRDALEKIKEDVKFVWHLGDIGYADDAFLHPLGPKYETVYNDWMNWIQNITESKPYMVAPGNHESECHSPECLASHKLKEALKNFTAYNTRWNMPFKESGATSNMWYSYDYGIAHFISIDTETDFPGAVEENHGDSGVIPAGHFGQDGEYIAWLEADLAKANATRGTRPWIFAGGHRPLYTGGGQGGSLNVAVEKLFHDYHVDLYFCGHEHSYARSLPVFDKKAETAQNKDHYVNPASTAYVLVGGAGNDEMTHGAEIGGGGLQNVYPPIALPNNTKATESASWNVYADAQYGTGVLTVFNATTIRWTYTHSTDMKVADQFYITKN